MIRSALASLLHASARSLSGAGTTVPEIEISEPRDPSHGDFACNFALTASKLLGKPPRQIAEELVAALPENDLIASTEIAGPGFINLRLIPGVAGRYVAQVLELGTDFARAEASRMGIEERKAEPSPSISRNLPQSPAISSNPPQSPAISRNLQQSPSISSNLPPSPSISSNPQQSPAISSNPPQSPAISNNLQQSPAKFRINLEYVSVNPNGPITVGSGRGAAFGSTLANVLEAAGHDVHREYYINDGTNSEQMRLFAESVRAVCLGQPVPENGYKGDYVHDAASNALFRLDSRLLERFVRGIESGELLIKGTPVNFEKHRKAQAELWTSIFDVVKNSPDRTSAFGMLTIEQIQRLTEFQMVMTQAIDLASFAVKFDTWFSEQSLHDCGAVENSIKDLIAKGAADEEPIRRKLKLAKGGVIEDVEVEAQGDLGDGDELGDGIGLGEGDDANNRGDASPSPLRERGPGGEGAEKPSTLWLRSTKFGDDMDRVLRRSDGRLTYIASDVAYHKDKFNRGSKPKPDGTTEKADKLITILGPDHHGYIGRLHAVVGALLESTEPLPYSKNENEGGVGEGVQPLSDLEQKLYRSVAERDACQAALAEAKEKLEVVIFQIVRFVKDGKPAPMRKRDGNIYSLRDLMSEIGKTAAPNEPAEEQMRIGKDVARFFYLMRSHDTHMDFDIDLATKQSDENPVFYCQYAHARICSILERAKLPLPPLGGRGQGMEGSIESESNLLHPQPPPHSPSSNKEGAFEHLHLLTHERELALIKKICDLPHEVHRCAEDYGVHRLTTYAQELAKSFHHFYDVCRVIQPEQPELTQARLALCEATRIGLKATFDLLGISAPTRMERTAAAEP